MVTACVWIRRIIVCVCLTAALGLTERAAWAQSTIVRGACCFANGTCQRFRQSVCEGRAGTWRGANTVCSPNPCPQPRGACCFADGGCAWVTQAGCASRGGAYLGNSTTCGVRTCPRPAPPAGNPGGGGGGGGGGNTPQPPPIGACCLANYSCIETEPNDCASRNGSFHGVGEVCFHVYCPAAAPPAACCFADGGCTMTTAIDCMGRGGYSRYGVACGATACAVGGGACCIGNAGSCQVLTQADCDSRSGRYRGNTTSCTNGGCVAGSGACCLQDSSCIMVGTTDCAAAQGRFRGVNLACSTQYCVSSSDVYACCTSDGTCQAMLQNACWSAHGVFQAGRACAPALCPMLGACCIPDGHCYFTGMSDCSIDPGAVFSASGSCNVNFCPRTCPCNWNGDRWVNEGDLFRFVSDYMAGHADYNNDGTTDDTDVRQFVDCLLHHPAGC